MAQDMNTENGITISLDGFEKLPSKSQNKVMFSNLKLIIKEQKKLNEKMDDYMDEVNKRLEKHINDTIYKTKFHRKVKYTWLSALTIGTSTAIGWIINRLITVMN